MPKSGKNKSSTGASGWVCCVCGVHLPKDDGISIRQHVLGRKHQRASNVAQIWLKMQDRSVALSIGGSLTAEDEYTLFKCLRYEGNVVDMNIVCSADSSSKSTNVVVVYDSRRSVEKVLKSAFTVGGKDVHVEPFTANIPRIAAKPRNKQRPAKVKPPKELPIPGARELILELAAQSSSKTPLEMMEWLRERIVLTPLENQARLEFCRELERFICQSVGRCSVYPFGSCVSGLGFHGCDLDVHVAMEGSIAWMDEKAKTKLVSRAMKKSPHLWSDLLALIHTRVPIIKIKCPTLLCSCDINFRNRLACRNSLLIFAMLNLDKRAHLLAVCVRFWAQVYELSGGNFSTLKLSSYCLTLMVIVYLQQLRCTVLPAVMTLQRDPDPPMIDHWNVGFNLSAVPQSVNTETAYALFQGFFRFYSDLDLSRVVLSPLLGQVISREQIVPWSRNTPAGLERYLQLVNRQIIDRIDCDKPVVVQDPFELNYNVAKNFHQNGLERFKKACHSACNKSFAELFQAAVEPHTVIRDCRVPKRKGDVSLSEQPVKAHRVESLPGTGIGEDAQTSASCS